MKGHEPQPMLSKSVKNDPIETAIKNIENMAIWKEIYCLFHAVFPALKVLRYCNSNIPAMVNGQNRFPGEVSR